MKLEVEQQYSVPQVAKLLNVSPATVWRELEKGQRTQGDEGIWPTYKLGHKQRRIPASAVQRYLETH